MPHAPGHGGDFDRQYSQQIADTASKIRGLEISKNRVQNCLSKGLTVIEGNAENDLQQFPNNSFDFVIVVRQRVGSPEGHAQYQGAY